MGARRTVQGLIAAAVTAALLAGVGGIVVAKQAIAATQTMWATTAVNIRAKATTASAVLAVLDRGKKITATGSSKNGWTPVKYSGKTAYIYSKYLKAQGATVSSGTTSTKASTMRTTTSLNVRTGPSTSYKVVGTLSKGTSVSLTGAKSGNWSQITYKGQKRWVAAGYLTSGSAITVKSTAVATCNMAVRSTSSSNYVRIATVKKGATLQLTGATRSGVTQVVWQGKARWVNSKCVKAYSASQPAKTSVSTKSTITRYTTANLNIRLNSLANSRVVAVAPKGTKLQLTGWIKNNRAQVIYNGGRYWAVLKYLSATKPTTTSTSSSSSSSSTTTSTSVRYTTATLNIRRGASTSAAIATVVARGTALKYTGVKKNWYAQILYNNKLLWVHAKYLTTKKPSTSTYSGGGSVGLSGLKASTKNVVNTVRSKFPLFVTFYGVRSDPLPDHPSGYAVDCMLPNYRSNNAYGWRAAKYLAANAKTLGIQYIIFDQKIWNISRSSEGWRSMADRGGDTANHKDHIHVTMKGLSIYS